MSCCFGDRDAYIALLEGMTVTVKIKYVGDRDEVVIAATGQTVKRLGVVEVPRDVADANVAGGEFERVKEPAKAAKAAPADEPVKEKS